jgi:transcription elongation factor GreA
MSEQGIWLTQEAYDRLLAELEQRKGPGRKEIAHKISEARAEGDLKENGGFHAAREEQGKNEARIVRLEQMLSEAIVGEEREASGVVEAGTVVTITLNSNEQTFLLGSQEIAEGTELDVYSPESPLGRAIIGQAIGAETSYTAPNGKTFAVKILNVETFVG